MTATPSLSNVRRSESQSTPLETRALALERFAADLHVDEVVGDEEVPLLGELADPLGPELDGVVAARDEAVAVFVRDEAEIAELARGVLLRGDVAADAARARAASSPAARRLHDDRRGHPVGAHVDLDVLVGRAERDVRLDERAAGAHAERRHEIDHVGDLRELGELGADLERDLRQPLRDELREGSRSARE